ncbi:MAG: tetratricopeptide repeat protein [Polyangiaceae bacterium]
MLTLELRRPSIARARWAALAALLCIGTAVAPSTAEPPKASPPPAPSAAPSSSSTSAATSPPPKDARERAARAVELHDEAKALYERGLYRRAITKLEAALELDPSGKELVYNLALIHEKLAEADIAEKYYLRYLDMETDPKARERAQVTVKRLQGAKKKIEADIQERATAPSASAVAMASGAPTAAEVPLRRTPSPMVFVIGGVGVAAAGIGIGFGISALSTHPDGLTTSSRVTSYDLEARARSAHTQAIVADLSFVTAFVMGAAAAVLYLVETRGGRGVPAVAPGGATAGTPRPHRAFEVPF